MFKKLLEFLFGSFKEEVQETVQEEVQDDSNVQKYPLGAFQEEADVRRISYAQVSAPVALPLEYITDTSKLPDFNQGMLGTCVAHAFAYAKMLLDFLETGKVIQYSRRFIYSLARKYGNFTNDDSQGLFPRDAVKVLTVIGADKERGLDDNTLQHSVYVNGLTVTEEMRKDAIAGQIGKYAFPDNTLFGLKQAVFKEKVVPVTILIDWSKIDSDGTVHAPKSIQGSHEVDIIGWQLHNGKERLIFKNWWGVWGTNGKGFINADEVEKVIVDSVVFTDVPNDLIERAKKTQYIFLTDLKVGMTSTAVGQLQKRLIAYGVATFKEPTNFFGPLTFNALVQYQKMKNLKADGVFGLKTREAMNNDSAFTKIKSKIDAWCEAIARLEKANPAYNNPGNIRYVGQAKATGQSQNGFCIFPDYQTGYMELRNMLVRACTGQSRLYSPDMTLYEFYAGVYNADGTKKYPGYAPKEDRNDPVSYAKFVGSQLGVSVETPIKLLL